MSRRMSAQLSRNTKIEMRLRSALHSRGLRYRLHQRPLRQHRRTADVVFGRAKVAVYVDGCFWHGCPQHATWPKRNAEFWRNKIATNIRRDRDTDASLIEAGWIPVRVWEHDDVDATADRIAILVKNRTATTKS
ncbi:very short patch repair endonuclease [Mycobacterium sp. GA-2829]|nr:very short patch repair endonuclease [Mycobacterium sp. GA-2829]KUI23030.1 very short patch repair endonuclease [Mycobacterium sp. GA-2829]